MTKPVVIFGVGSLAQLAHDYLTYDSDRKVEAFTVDGDRLRDPELRGLPVVPSEELLDRYPPDTHDMFVAIGYSRMNKVRAAKCAQARERGYRLVTYVSSRASVWPGLEIGDNCFIMEHNIIQPTARIGDDVVMWGGCHVGHDSVIEDDVFVCAHTVVSGFVTVGRRSFIGVNATIRDGISIGEECVVGAGVTLTKSVEARTVLAAPKPEVLPITSDRLPNL